MALAHAIDLMITSASAAVWDAFIKHIPVVPHDAILPFIDSIPAIFRLCGNLKIEELAKALFGIIEDSSRHARSDLLLRLLCALSELTLSKQLASTVVKLTYAVVDDASSKEMPSVLQILVRSWSSPDVGSTISMWRDKVGLTIAGFIT